jgi:hypothetical protein
MARVGFHRLDDLIFSVNKTVIGKKGIHYQKLLKNWSKIVGDISCYSIPVKISTIKYKNKLDNILHVAANNAAAATQLVYFSGVIKEQINFYFGYDYIQQIKFVQAVFSVRERPVLREVSEMNLKQKNKMADLLIEYDQEDEIKAILTNIASYLVNKA